MPNSYAESKDRVTDLLSIKSRHKAQRKITLVHESSRCLREFLMCFVFYQRLDASLNQFWVNTVIEISDIVYIYEFLHVSIFRIRTTGSSFAMKTQISMDL